jgi:hypothetical protein
MKFSLTVLAHSLLPVPSVLLNSGICSSTPVRSYGCNLRGFLLHSSAAVRARSLDWIKSKAGHRNDFPKDQTDFSFGVRITW